MKHCAITVIAEIDARDPAVARQRLQQITAAQSATIRGALFDACAACRALGPDARCDACKRRVHFLSFFAFPDPGPDAAPVAGPSFVVLELNGDGSARALLRRLAERAPQFLEQLFRDCKGTPGASASARDWYAFLRAHDVGADAFYIANPGRSVEQVAIEKRLRERAQQELAAVAGALDCTSVWRVIKQHMADMIRDAEPAPRLPFRMRWGTHRKGLFKQLPGYARLLGAALALVLAGIAALCWWWSAWWLPEIWLPRTTNLVLALLVPWLIGFAWMRPMWLKERPVHASRAFKRTSWRIFVKAWLWCGVKLTPVLGTIPAALWLCNLPFAKYQAVFAHVAAAMPTLFGLVTAVVLGVFVGLASGKLSGYLAALLASTGWLALSVLCWSEPQQLWLLWLIVTGLSMLMMGALIVWFLAKVREDERKDIEPEIGYDLPRLDANTLSEDTGLLNHLATVTELRPEPIRHYALRVVLRAVSLLATVHFNHGDLDRISSIHFARFLIYSHSGKHWLLFMGNYDGGFSAYLGAFSPVYGTSAVWSCTKEFPKTLGLIWDGARDEQRFKAFGRKSQVRTLGWFSAHHDLSTHDIAAGTATRMALNREPSGPRPEAAWKRLGRALFGPPGEFESEVQGPFDEAACDAAVRRL